MLIDPWVAMGRHGKNTVSSHSGSRTPPVIDSMAPRLQAISGFKTGFHQVPAPSHLGICLPPVAINMPFVPRLSVQRGAHRPTSSCPQHPRPPSELISAQSFRVSVPSELVSAQGSSGGGGGWCVSVAPRMQTPGWVTTVPGLSYNFAPHQSEH